jgi:hypothetical protein
VNHGAIVSAKSFWVRLLARMGSVTSGLDASAASVLNMLFLLSSLHFIKLICINAGH